MSPSARRRHTIFARATCSRRRCPARPIAAPARSRLSTATQGLRRPRIDMRDDGSNDGLDALVRQLPRDVSLPQDLWLEIEPQLAAEQTRSEERRVGKSVDQGCCGM